MATHPDDRCDSLYREEKTGKVPSASKEVLMIAPVLNFVTRIAMQSDSTCQAVLEAGILDILLRIYIIFPALSSVTPHDNASKEELRSVCGSTLTVLGQSQQYQITVLNHPVCILWPDCHSQPPVYAVDEPVQDRCTTWRRLHASCVHRRVIVIYKGPLWKPSHDAADDTHVCGDIVEFTK